MDGMTKGFLWTTVAIDMHVHWSGRQIGSDTKEGGGRKRLPGVVCMCVFAIVPLCRWTMSDPRRWAQNG